MGIFVFFNCVLSCAVADAEVHWCAGNLGKSGGRRVGGRGRGGRHPVPVSSCGIMGHKKEDYFQLTSRTCPPWLVRPSLCFPV